LTRVIFVTIIIRNSNNIKNKKGDGKMNNKTVEKELRYEDLLQRFIEENNVKEKETYSNLINKINDYDKWITTWTNKDLEELITDVHSISSNTIKKYVQCIRTFYN
jgi:hypothetical protein